MKNLLLELLGWIIQSVFPINSLLQNKAEISDNKGIFYYPFTVSLKIYSQASVCEHSYVWMLLIALWDCRWLKKSVVGSEIYLLTSIFSICCNSHIHAHAHGHALQFTITKWLWWWKWVKLILPRVISPHLPSLFTRLSKPWADTEGDAHNFHSKSWSSKLRAKFCFLTEPKEQSYTGKQSHTMPYFLPDGRKKTHKVSVASAA